MKSHSHELFINESIVLKYFIDKQINIMGIFISPLLAYFQL